ncbi:CmcI family methyltransferase [Ruegeria sp. HKCCE3926]|uniref:CmcI family methyltransferase n=1 Tax=Ruegeria sp. HKCCE3926 TaxID=2794831 RepID=UPI001AE13458|nr:CmcI family methyltransferase [Ruegeria sp. HKCCE3926]
MDKQMTSKPNPSTSLPTEPAQMQVVAAQEDPAEALDPLAEHTLNPDVRPQEQNIDNEEGAFGTTPPVPRPFGSTFTPDILAAYHAGVMKYQYRGVTCLKSPIDLAVYMLILFEKKPGTIVEIGSFHGGAAMFYRDITRAWGLDTQVITVDFRSNQYQDEQVGTEGIEFVQTDALKLDGSDLEERLKTAPRPWMVIEDSAHTFEVSYAVLEYFKSRMQTGECLIVEDGIIEDQGANWRYDGGPNRAVHEFFLNNPDEYRLMDNYNDFFGYNLSFNPNGYLEKT